MVPSVGKGRVGKGGGGRGGGGRGGCFGRRPYQTDGREQAKRKKNGLREEACLKVGRKGGCAAASVSGGKGAKRPCHLRTKTSPVSCGTPTYGGRHVHAGAQPKVKILSLERARYFQNQRWRLRVCRAPVPGPMNQPRQRQGCEAHRAGNGPSPWATATLSAPRKTGPRRCCSTGNMGGVGALRRKSFGAKLPWGKNGEPRCVTP